MKKYTQKQIREFVKLGVAEDITTADNNDRRRILEKEKFLHRVGESFGVYGCNGMLLQGEATGKLYAITSRSTSIFIFG